VLKLQTPKLPNDCICLNHRYSTKKTIHFVQDQAGMVSSRDLINLRVTVTIVGY
jgi:predicted metalloenzyme YecM